MEKQPESVRYLRVAEWHLITGDTIWAAYRALNAGTLRGVKIGGRWFIERSELDNYFERNGRRVTAA